MTGFMGKLIRATWLPGLVIALAGCSQTSQKEPLGIDYAKFAQQNEPLNTELNDAQEYEFALDLAKLSVERKHYSRAEGLLQKLRKANGQDIRVYRLLAQMYEAQSKLPTALVAWQEANKLPSKTVDDESEWARLALMQDQYAVAEAIYQAWLSSNEVSRQVSGLNNLGFSALLQKQYPTAKEYFGKALQKDPLNSKARSNLQLLNSITE
ncbi:tetratricopeptide repeat protein [Thiomicrorhabdus aquaedulcis]|uniref:tetratricopeptide repeat protein n=1 Tax=Thiomicrorhabdus aquaedulcis TaxID=2211106 RepID=UPI001562BAD1|nr:tetratricopeptide repeat protein [Thiomicrorhabdus aquaedulcis]